MKKASKKQQLNIRLTPLCVEIIKALANETGVSQSAIIEMAVRDAKKKHDRKNK